MIFVVKIQGGQTWGECYDKAKAKAADESPKP